MDEQPMQPVQPVQPVQPSQPAQQPASPSQGGSEAPKHDGQKNTGMAVVAYILFFIPLLTDAKNDPFVKFHVKQGLLVFIGWVITWVLGMFLFWSFYWLIDLLDLGLLILAILGIMNALNGKMEALPVVGKFADSFKF